MSTEANKALVRRLHDLLWYQGADKPALMRDIVAADAVSHAPDGSTRSASGQFAGYLEAFPDLRNTLDLLVAEDDLVVRRWTNEGTHLGTFVHPHYGSFPPTGKRVRWSGVNVYRIRDGKIAENWPHVDLLGLLQQIGATVVAPGATPPEEIRP